MYRQNRFNPKACLLGLAFLGTLVPFGPAVAEGEGATASSPESEAVLGIELNSTLQNDAACRVTLMVENKLGADLDSAVFETVLFTQDGLEERLTLFDFQTLPQGRPRVRQFDLAGLNCPDLGRILINGVQACSGDGIEAASCLNNMSLTSRIDVEILG
jgi:hypothetical protein